MKNISYDDFGSTEMPTTIFRVTSVAKEFVEVGPYATCASHHATAEDATAEMESRALCGHTDITVGTYVQLSGDELDTIVASLDKQLVEPPAV